jgi:hypothetical protein
LSIATLYLVVKALLVSCFTVQSVLIMGISNHDHKPVNAEPSLMNGLEMEEESSIKSHAWQEGRAQPAYTPEQPQSPKRQSDEKHVSFASLSIREYTQVLGDHPCCTIGPPVSLGWDYTEATSVSLEDYEAARPLRRTRQAMRLSWDKRREILSEYSDADVRRVQRKLSRQRCNGEKVLKTFFSEPTTVTE